MPLPVRLKHVHIFALVHDRGVALFDTGVNSPETISTLEHSLKTIGKTIHDIDQIFVTHFHSDHCGLAGRIKEDSGAVIYMSDIDGQRENRDQTHGLDVQQIKKFYYLQGLEDRTIHSLVGFLNSFKSATIPFEANRLLVEHECHTVGGRTFEIVPAAGHTRGQVCFFFRKEGILLSGDHVLPYITPNISPDPYYPAFRPLHSYLKSLAYIKSFPVKMVWPSHGEPFSDLKKRVEEIEEHHRERKTLILDAVKRGARTAYQVSLDVFGTDLPEFDRFLAVNETYAHLLELREEGLVTQEQKGDLLLYTDVQLPESIL